MKKSETLILKLPLVVRVSIEQTSFDMDAVDAEIYCVNETSKDFIVSVASNSFTTGGF